MTTLNTINLRYPLPRTSGVVWGTVPVVAGEPMGRFFAIDDGGAMHQAQVMRLAKVSETIEVLDFAFWTDNPEPRDFGLAEAPGAAWHPDTPTPNKGILKAIFEPDTLRLTATVDDQEITHSISAKRKAWVIFREGPLRGTYYRHLRFGQLGCHVILDVKAGLDQLDVTLNWHNGIPGPGAKLETFDLLASGVDIYRTIEDRGLAAAPSLQEHAYGPTTPQWHPQRWERPCRFSIVAQGKTPERPGAGFAVADWPEGWTAASLRVPDLQHVQSTLQRDLDDARDKLRSRRPFEGGASPTSAWWLGAGDHYGGVTGGVEHTPGVRLAAWGDPAGVELEMIRQLRWRTRHPGCIYEESGEPVKPEAHLQYAVVPLIDPVSQDVHGGVEEPSYAQWWAHDRQFTFTQGKHWDEPFRFSAHDNTPPEGYPDPTVWDPVDDQHAIRAISANMALAWLTGDPLAILYLRTDAAVSRMTFWNKPGAKRRINPPATREAFPIGWGRAEAWSAVTCMNAAAFERCDPTHPDATVYDQWGLDFASVAHRAVLPSGLFMGINHVKGQPWPNEELRQYAQRGNEIAYMLFALASIYHGTGHWKPKKVLEDLLRGMRNAAWKWSGGNPTGGGMDIHPLGKTPDGPFYESRADWSPELQAAMESVPGDRWYVGDVLAFARRYDEDWISEESQFLQFEGQLESDAEILTRWGIKSPYGSPIETWGQLLAEAQR